VLRFPIPFVAGLNELMGSGDSNKGSVFIPSKFLRLSAILSAHCNDIDSGYHKDTKRFLLPLPRKGMKTREPRLTKPFDRFYSAVSL